MFTGYQDQGRAPTPPKAPEQPILMDCNKRINSRIGLAHEAATRIENALDRLLNSEPRPASGNVEKPLPQTIEAMLNETDSYAEGLASRLHDLASRLERAA